MPSLEPFTDPAVAAAIERLLTELGPMPQEDLARALGEAGLPGAEDPAALLDDALSSDSLPLVLLLHDKRVAHLPTLLAGRVFTHRVSAAEVESDVVVVSPDFEPLSILCEDDTYRQLAGGGDLVEAWSDTDPELFEARGITPGDAGQTAWLLPPGTLAGLGLAGGDLVAFGAGPAGWLVSRVAEADVASAPSDLAARMLALMAAEQTPAEIAEIIWQACADDPALFTTPLPPLGGLLESLGLAVEGDWVAPGGFDFDQWHVTGAVSRVGAIYALDEDQSLAVVGASALLMAGDEEASDDDVRATLAWLADPDVAEAVLFECLDDDREYAELLAESARAYERRAPHDARQALRWLHAKALERMGAVAEAEEALDAAESLDPAWQPTLFDLARYASDRGDAERGLSLLDRAGADPKDGLVALLERFRPQGTAPGRNDPCWCGSGRKSKQCHRGAAPLPLSERATWLYGKAGVYLEDGPWRGEHVELAYLRAADWEGEDAAIKALADPVVGDALLFEGGAFAEFVAERGFLLPEDEQELARLWLQVRRSVHVVVQVRPGSGLTLRDVRTGQAQDVSERTLSGLLQPGDQICARVVPAGDTMRIFGGIEPVDERVRDQLLELLGQDPDPYQVVQLLSLRFTPTK